MLTKDATRRIEWMELLRVNITGDGQIVKNRHDRVSLVEDDTHLCESTSKISDAPIPTQKKNGDSVNTSVSSNSAYSPPTGA